MQAADDILHKFLDKDRQAFELVFKAYYSDLCGFAMKYLNHPDQAEGLVQDLFCYLWENIDRLVIKTSLKSYLYQAVRNRAFNQIQYQKVRGEYKTWFERNSDQVLDGSKMLETKELEGKISKAIADLPERCREVFLLSRNEGKKYREIADTLGISVKTVENQMGKAIKHLRTELNDYLPLSLLVWYELSQMGVFESWPVI